MRFSPESQQFGNEQEKKEVVRVRVRAGKIEGWRESGREDRPEVLALMSTLSPRGIRAFEVDSV